MRVTILLLTLVTASPAVAMGGHMNPGITNSIAIPIPATLSQPCRGGDISVKQVDADAAMGGVRTVDYIFTNKSAAACTLSGYPSYRLLDKRGRLLRHGRAVKSDQLPGDETKQAPQLVTVEPGKDAWFRVYYNSGGAGYIGKPCPTARKIKIIAPGTTRVFILRDEITLCADLRVSSVGGGPRQ